MTLDYTEIINAAADAIAADTDFTDLLATGSKVIYQGNPQKTLAAPFCHWEWNRVRSRTSAEGRADWDITMRVFAPRMSICRAIEGVLAENWQIPTQRVASVASTNHRLTELLLLSSTEIDQTVRVGKDMSDLRMLVLIWSAKTRKRTNA